MNKFQKILVCIKNPLKDMGLLEYADVLSRKAGSARQFHVLHVRENAIADQHHTHGTGLPEPVTLEELQGRVADRLPFDASVSDTVCVVATGTPLYEILRYGMEQGMDLIVVGGQEGQSGGSHPQLSHRLARKATCSVLAVPRGTGPAVSRILVPVRDTDCSARAVQAACRVAKGINATVCCLNVFPIGSGYSKLGISLEEQMSRLKKVAEHEVQRLLVGIDGEGLKTEIKCLPDPYAQPVQIILDECERSGADLLVVGSRGRTGPAGVILGSVTEELIAQCEVPVLAVKRKGEQIGVVQALLSLA